MSDLKGEEQAIASILPGTPLEVPPGIEVFNASGHKIEPQTPLLGIAVRTDYADWLEFLTPNGTPMSVRTGSPLKVLTGLKGGELVRTLTKALATTDYRGLFNYRLSLSLSIGSDPEVFVVNQADALIPAYLFLGRRDEALGTQAYWDGFQAEFCHPSHGCLEEMSNDIQHGLKTILRAAKAYDPTAKLTLRNVLPIAQETLQAAKEEHVALGCAPSYNAYGRRGLRVDNGRQLGVRFAGGHMHFGIPHSLNKEVEQWRITEAVKMLDVLIGVPSVSLAACVDDPIRRQWYGLAGEYRTPKYGLEYRTLSNFWLAAPCIYHLCFDLARWGVRLGLQGLRSCTETNEEQVQEIINTCDVKAARKFLEAHKTLYMSALAAAYGEGTPVKQGFETFLNGMEYIVANPFDIEGNWGLKNGEWQRNSGGKGAKWYNAAKHRVAGEKV